MLNTLLVVVFAQAEERRSVPGKESKIHLSKSIFSVCLHIVDLKPEFRCIYSFSKHTHTHTPMNKHTQIRSIKEHSCSVRIALC